MNTLVLGGSVFVGKRLVAALTAAGHSVTVLNRGKTPAVWPAGVRHIAADRTDPASMRAALDGAVWDAVFDVSGFVMAAGGSDIESLLDLVRDRVGHYVYVSSIMAYDQALVGWLPWTEDLGTNGEGSRSYGGFKALVEAALLRRHVEEGFPATIVRPAAIYGPDNNIYDMEAAMFLRLLQHRPILLPYSGLVSGSYGHVDDLCEWMVSVVGRTDAMGEIVNLTTDGVTSRRYVEVLAAVVGEQPRIMALPEESVPSGGAPVFGHLFGARHHGVLSIEKARRLGYSPRYDLVRGHEHAYAWFVARGWSGLDTPLKDPTWGATWDFEAEAALARALPAAAR